MSAVQQTGRPGDENYRVAVFFSRPRLAIMVLATAACAVLCGGVVAVADTTAQAPVLFQAVGVLGAVFCGWAMVFCLRRLVQRTPAVIVDATGVHDHASAISSGTIPWDNVRVATTMRWGLQRMLSVSVFDAHAVVAHATGPRRALLALNVRMMATPVNVPGLLLSVSLDTVETAINDVIRAQRHGHVTGELPAF